MYHHLQHLILTILRYIPGLHRPPTTHPNSPHHPDPGGCAPAWLIFIFAAILIITSIISIGLTVLSPDLSALSGSTDITLGGTLQLHGTHFIPGSSVTFTLDGTTPLFFSRQGSNGLALHSANSLPALAISSIDSGQLPSASNSVAAGIDWILHSHIFYRPELEDGTTYYSSVGEV